MTRTDLCWWLSIAPIVASGCSVSEARNDPAQTSQSSAIRRARAFDVVPLETVSETSSNASIGDLNGDGHPDVVLVKGRHWQVRTVVFFADGKGHFARDGHADIAACPENLGCFVFFSAGNGSFGGGVRFDTPKAVPYSMVATDLNRDSRPDILVGDVEAAGVAYFNDGTGRLYERHPFGDGKGAIYGMAAADLKWRRLARCCRGALGRSIFRHVQPRTQGVTWRLQLNGR